MNSDNFDIWDQLIPVISAAGDSEFNIWSQLVPFCDQEESSSLLLRRRVSEY